MIGWLRSEPLASHCDLGKSHKEPLKAPPTMHDKIHWLKNLLPPSSPLRRSQSDRKLLAMQPMTLEAFLQEEEQMAKDQTCDSSARPIPALLLPNETLEQYEESFILWLGRRNVTVPSLQDEPIVERRFRLDFADSRAWELRRRNIASVASTSHKSAVSNPDHHEVIADGTSASRSEGGGKAKPAGRHPYQGIRSRKELLAKSVMNVDQFSARMEYFGPNGDMFAGSRLSPIAVVLRPYETLAEFELNFKRWLAMKKVSLNMLQDDPEEERRYRQCFAYARLREHTRRQQFPAQQSASNHSIRSPTRKVSDAGLDHDSERTAKRPRLNSEEQSLVPLLSEVGHPALENKHPVTLDALYSEASLPQCIRDWAEGMTQRVKQLETQVNHFQTPEQIPQKPPTPRGKVYRSSPVSSNQIEAPECNEPPHSDDMFSAQPSRNRSRISSHDNQFSATDSAVQSRHAGQHTSHAQSVAEVTDNQLADVVFIKTEQSRSAVIFQEATATLEKSVRMNEDLVKKRLTQDYTRLTDQIASNETSIEDSLAYVNLIVNIDKAGTADHLNQIKKLTISINKEKRRRDTVLATLIAHDWSDRHEELNSHLHRRDRGRNPSGSHEKLVSIYGKLEKKGDEMLALQAKLKSRLGWLNGGDTGRDAQFEELQELKNRMEVEISALSRLEVQRQMLCVDLLRSNEAVCRLAMELIEEPKHTTAKAKATPV